MSPPLTFERNGALEALIVSELSIYFDAIIVSDSQINDAYARALNLIDQHIRLYRAQTIVRYRTADNHISDLVSQWISTALLDRTPLYIDLSSALSEESVGPYSLRLYHPALQDPVEVGALRITLPFSICATSPEQLRSTFVGIVECLGEAWGSAGFGIEWNTRRSIPERDAHIRLWCSKFRGVDHKDFDNTFCLSSTCIPSISWITRLPAKLRQTLPSAPDFFFANDVPSLDYIADGPPALRAESVHRSLHRFLCPSGSPPAGFDPSFLASWRRRYFRRTLL